LGSAVNDECQIDSISQSWAVLSGAGQAARNRSALDALDQRLVRRELGLIQLLTPPFDHSLLNPGYIKGYLPGVRENGGQYTHAAIWAVMAFAAQGDPRRAWECFDLINPLRHGHTPEAVARYQVEPYVVAADVYAVPPHEGRGGWTWYTGSASWMYRLMTESLLGLRRQDATLVFTPCLPREWSGFSLQYRWGLTVYEIEVQQVNALDSVEEGSFARTEGVAQVKPVGDFVGASTTASIGASESALVGIVVVLDGVPQVTPVLHLHDDGAVHRVVVRVQSQGTNSDAGSGAETGVW
jgi:cellobiose phosphorylase